MKTSVWENLKTIAYLVFSNKDLIFVSLLALVVLFIFILDSKSKIFKKATNAIIIYVLLISLSLLIYPKEIIVLFDIMLSGIIGLVINVSYLKFIVIIFISQIMLINSLYFDKDKVTKTINSVFYVLLNFLFVISLNYLKTKKIALKTLDQNLNEELVSIMKISTILFITWIYLLLLRVLSKKIVKRKKEFKTKERYEKEYEMIISKVQKGV